MAAALSAAAAAAAADAVSITTKAVAKALGVLEQIAPLRLAESAWDNVGLLVQAPLPRPGADHVLLTVDLTPRVLSEAVSDQSIGLIVAYHPTIFRGWKRLNLFTPHSATPQDPETVNQDTVLRLVANGISLYSPHTALDNRFPNGVNDWLARAFSGNSALRSVKPISPRGANDAEGGAGRLIEFEVPQTKTAVVDAIKRHLGLTYVQYAAPQPDASMPAAPDNMPQISTVAICAGSGGSLFLPQAQAASRPVADMYWTGELSHHEVLKLSATSHVVLCGHSNTERGFLSQVLALELAAHGVKVKLSKLDRDPLRIE